MEVEDHPVEYGSFEGTIPKGQYGGGSVLLWDRGTWTPIGDPHEGLRRGNPRFELVGEKLQGTWVLIRIRGRADEGDKKNWLLIKEREPGTRSRRRKDILVERPESVLTGRTIEKVSRRRPLRPELVGHTSCGCSGYMESAGPPSPPSFHASKIPCEWGHFPAGMEAALSSD